MLPAETLPSLWTQDSVDAFFTIIQQLPKVQLIVKNDWHCLDHNWGYGIASRKIRSKYPAPLPTFTFVG
jgi:hypothetical protein